jgi:hypothetical protein
MEYLASAIRAITGCFPDGTIHALCHNPYRSCFLDAVRQRHWQIFSTPSDSNPPYWPINLKYLVYEPRQYEQDKIWVICPGIPLRRQESPGTARYFRGWRLRQPRFCRIPGRPAT